MRRAAEPANAGVWWSWSAVLAVVIGVGWWLLKPDLQVSGRKRYKRNTSIIRKIIFRIISLILMVSLTVRSEDLIEVKIKIKSPQ